MTFIDTKQMEKNILWYLKQNCFGIQNAISREALARRFHIPERTLRQLKRNIVLNTDSRVGSTKNGYWYADSQIEIRMFRADYLSRMKEFREMVDAYGDRIDNENQMTLGEK